MVRHMTAQYVTSTSTIIDGAVGQNEDAYLFACYIHRAAQHLAEKEAQVSGRRWLRRS